MNESIRNFWNITVPVMFILSLILELILYWFFWVRDPYEFIKSPVHNQSYIESQFKPHLDLEFEVESFLPHMDEKVRFTTNNFGFRGEDINLPKGEDEFRIFLFGGSTLENMYVDDEKSAEFLLQKKFNSSSGRNIKVFNTAKSGDASPDHLAMLIHRVVHLQPDLIIIYSGLNDLTRLIAGYDYFHQATYVEDGEASWKLGLKLFLSNFQIYRRFHAAIVDKTSGLNPLSRIFMQTNYEEKIAYVEQFEIKGSFDRQPDYQLYYHNMNSFVGACQSNQIPVVVLTQAATWGAENEISNYHWMNYISEKRYDDSLLGSALNKINEINQRVAEEKELPLLDIDRIIPRTTEYFYDDCHFNTNGVKLFSDKVYTFVVENKLLD